MAKQEHLTETAKLLDLRLAEYPEIISIQKDLSGLSQIYNIYKAHKVGCGCFLLKNKQTCLPCFITNLLIIPLRRQKQSGPRPCG